MKPTEMERLDATTAVLNEARITVVEFLDDVEVRQRLSIQQAVTILQQALKQYAEAISLIEGSSVDSIISTYYRATKECAAVEKRLVAGMFRAVLKQNVPAFNRYYQVYVRSLLSDFPD